MFRFTSIAALGFIASLTCAGLPSAAAPGGMRLQEPVRAGGTATHIVLKTPAPAGPAGLATTVQDRVDPLCREELELLATLQREGPTARRALEALGRVARCDTVKAAIAAALASMSASASDPGSGDQIKSKGADKAARDRKDGGAQSSEAKPDGQIRKADDADEADKRRKAEAVADEAERRRLTEEADKLRKAEADAERRRKAEEEAERREAVEAKRAKDRAREAARKKIDERKVEVKRKLETTTRSSSRGGIYGRCEAQIRAKYSLLDPREYQIRLTQCLATGSVY